jgi:acyl-CoA thioesterase-1
MDPFLLLTPLGASIKLQAVGMQRGIHPSPECSFETTMRTESSRTVLLIGLSYLLSGCGADAPPSERASQDHESRKIPVNIAGTPARYTIAFLGDSLTSGYGLEDGEREAYPVLVESLLRGRGWAVRTLNQGVAGDTSAGALRRTDWLLRAKPDLVVIAIGANDGLRLLDLKAMEGNLSSIVGKLKARGVRVALAGMRIHTSTGKEFHQEFEAVYKRVASERDIPLLPFLLEGVAGEPELNGADGIHPNAAGHTRIATRVATWLTTLLPPAARRPQSKSTEGGGT